MSRFSVKSQEDRDDVMVWISDLYKDAYGVRPRGYDFNEWTNEELEDLIADLEAVINREKI